MMKEQGQIKNEIRQWIAANRQALPLHADNWIIEVTIYTAGSSSAGQQVHSKPPAARPIAFYKPYTKTCIVS